MKFFETQFYRFLNKAFSGKAFWLSMIILFIFRTLYGLSYKFSTTDELQVFLIGLKYFTTGIWPYFGADVVHTASRLPGAFQGFIIGVPWHIWQVPEAPYILLNLVSMVALGYLAKYIVKRIPKIPKGFIYLWLFTCPWTLNYSTHIINPSYLYWFSIPFFIAVLELWVFQKDTLYRKRFLLFLMGFAIGMSLQLHLSVVILMAIFGICLLVFVAKTSSQNGVFALIPFLLGIGVTLLFYIPTFLEYAELVSGGTEKNINFSFSRVDSLFWVWLRGLGFASIELNEVWSRLPAAMSYLKQHPVMWILFVPLTLVGIAHILYMTWRLVKPNVNSLFKEIRLILWVTLVLTAALFLFSVKGPIGFSFMIIFPLVFFVSILAIQPLFTKPKMRMIMSIAVLANILYHGIFALHSYNSQSLYASKDNVLMALESKEYTFVGKRRQAYFEKTQLRPVWIQDKTVNSRHGRRFTATFDDQVIRFPHQKVTKNYYLSAEYANLMHRSMRESIHFIMDKQNTNFKKVDVRYNYYQTAADSLRFQVELRRNDSTIYTSIYPLGADSTLAEWQKAKFTVDDLPAIPDTNTTLHLFFKREANDGDGIIYLDDVSYFFRRR